MVRDNSTPASTSPVLDFPHAPWTVLGMDAVLSPGGESPLDSQAAVITGWNDSGHDSVNGTWSLLNVTPATTTMDPNYIPRDLSEMSPRARNTAIIYGILFIIAATGNLSVFMSVLNQLRKTKSRICLLILHLSIADLVVTFFLMPMEIIWRITVAWYGGNSLCKICQFLRAFGLYLSSNVLICISLDRYFAIIHPLRTSGARRRGRAMLAAAWASAALCSFPQVLTFEVISHPQYKAFQQCVTGFFGRPGGEDVRAYSIASVSIMYFLPLVVIMFTYSRIIWKMNHKSRQHRESCKNSSGEAGGRILLRRSDASNNLERAKNRTLKLTLVIVLVFVMCWTPYVVITLWYMFDWAAAERVDQHVQEYLFIMAVANSCVNPLVYGSYTKECRETMSQCCITDSSRRSHGIQPSRMSKATISSRTVTTSDGASFASNTMLRDSLRKHLKNSSRNHPNRNLDINFSNYRTTFFDEVQLSSKYNGAHVHVRRSESATSVQDPVNNRHAVLSSSPGRCYECELRALK